MNRSRRCAGSTARARGLAFPKSRAAIATEVAALVVFGGFAAIAFASGTVFVGLILGSFCVAAVGLLLMGSAGDVLLDGRAIEGPSPTGRTRIAYADVLQILHWPSLDTTIVCSEHQWLMIPSGYDGRGQVLTVLWDRVHRAVADAQADAPGSEDDRLPQLRDALAGVRRGAGFRLRDAARPPSWMTLRRWNHPLHPQFREQRRLLRHGRLVMARVVTANPLLFRVPRDEARFDAPAIVIFAVDSTDGPAHDDLLSHILTALANPRFEAAEWFAGATVASGGFPLMVPVPPSLSQECAAYCTSVMIARRQIPLGYLRSRWLPLLVSPPDRLFAMVLPMRLWNAAARDDWKRGDADSSGPD